MPGAPDKEYVAARRVLLDALDALTAHFDALVLVGAQAIYLHAGEGDLAVAPYTNDADIAVNPAALTPERPLEATMLAAGFILGAQPGIWAVLTNPWVTLDGRLSPEAALEAGLGSNWAMMGSAS